MRYSALHIRTSSRKQGNHRIFHNGSPKIWSEEELSVILPDVTRLMCHDLKRVGINKPIFSLSPKDFDVLVMDLEDDPIKDRAATILGYKRVLKKLYKWKFEEPPKWIRDLKITRPGTPVQPSDLPSKEEFDRFLNAAPNPRDKALIAVMADGGIRIGAALYIPKLVSGFQAQDISHLIRKWGGVVSPESAGSSEYRFLCHSNTIMTL